MKSLPLTPNPSQSNHGALARLAAALHVGPAPSRSEPLPLARDATLALRPGRAGLEVVAERGTALVTQAGDPLDHVLEAGAHYRTGRRGRVVVWALTDAEVRVAGQVAR